MVTASEAPGTPFNLYDCPDKVEGALLTKVKLVLLPIDATTPISTFAVVFKVSPITSSVVKNVEEPVTFLKPEVTEIVPDFVISQAALLLQTLFILDVYPCADESFIDNINIIVQIKITRKNVMCFFIS